ncbi:hypothetical protein [Portibacter lacus]|uniref:Uncharacterized protein n=1 Tax=Portibacter lacus TaxID=1099794 RepID=A0AA37WDY4_9BACT|nr:hypothetical protein [Portibacter lacus]GLR16527.1 hypothetical protein GCM10007940_11420 [Portibacter lacus]
MNNLKQVFSTVKSSSPILYWFAMFILLLAGLSFVGLFTDDRVVQGISVWLKPLKFTISTVIYMMTVGFLINFYPYSNRKKKIINGIVAWTLLLEMIIIPLQGFRGVQSHYNQNTLFDGVLFGCMGIFIGINVILMMIFIVDTVRLKLNTEKSVQWAIFLGWAVVLLGSWVGGQMISQMAHNVGVADGGAGIPILNWSTKGGDLRIAHFFGLHGIQIIPLFALWASKKWKNSNRNQVIAVTTFSLIYAGWITYTFYQAKQGIPLIAIN